MYGWVAPRPPCVVCGEDMVYDDDVLFVADCDVRPL